MFVCRSYRVVWNLGLQIAVDWLHECCHVVLPRAQRDAGWRRDVSKLIVMAASRFLGATSACAILLSLAADHRKSYWNGCMKVAMVICYYFFGSLALVIFLLENLIKKPSKSCCRDPVLEL